jgi:tetraacyldisaccharide 4'-kinase
VTRDRPPIPAPLARLAEPIYRFAVARRNAAFDRGRGVTRLPIPVISVGNLTVGGTGKTPLVMQILRWALDAAHRPAVAMRGYRAARAALSDEHAEYLAVFPNLSIIAQPDRLAGLAPLIQAKRIDSVILDDGFQHRRIHRDLDLVLIDASRPLLGERCLPAGWLREPVDSLRRAHAVILTHAESAPHGSIDQLTTDLSRITGRPPLAVTRHAWSHLTVIRDRESRTEPVEWLMHRPVVAACAIGHPTPFLGALRTLNPRSLTEYIRRDHHDWSLRNIESLRRAAATDAVIATTQKDWTKFSRLTLAGLTFAIPHLTLRFDAGEPALRDQVLRSLASRTLR